MTSRMHMESFHNAGRILETVCLFYMELLDMNKGSKTTKARQDNMLARYHLNGPNVNYHIFGQ